ncbi:septation protein SepH, partial [Kocuria sp.]
MEQLRLAGVHDDGEHLVVEDETGTRRLLRIDQELRLAVQRARRLPAARQRGGQFGPREIQARFRAGATVDEIVAESGWEAARVRRYEWPILAERAHVAAEAQKVEIEDPTAHRGYHSVFEGEPLTLGRAVAHRAGELGVDPASLEWDSWQREDQLWTVVARFVVVDPAAAPGEEPSPAEWIFNPANQSVRSANAWAEALTEPERPDTPITAG